MPSLTDRVSGPISTVESFFDQIKLGYKWRFGRWKHLQIVAYRGHGSSEQLYLKGRVLDDKNIPPPEAHEPVWRNLVRTVRRIETDEIPGARVRLTFQGQQLEAETDEDGYFDFAFAPEEALPEGRVWHEGTLDLLLPEPEDPADVRAPAYFLVAAPDAEFAVISDLDDTVVRTGATNKLQMARIVAFNNAATRTPFPGVGAFYQALQKGPDDKGHNPIFYVSSSPYNLYGLFDYFFETHGIPHGPIFLKDYGFSPGKFFTTSHEAHKLEQIRRLLDATPDLDFVLVGDSGQHDAEIYRTAVEEHPERIRAIFVRDVATPARAAEVRAIAQDVAEAGVPMVLAETSTEAAEAAARLGLIREAHVEAVREGKAKEESEKDAPSGLTEELLENPPSRRTWALAGGAGALAAGLGAWLLRRGRRRTTDE